MKLGATDTVFEGFRITRQKPVVLLWLGLVYGLSGAITIAAVYPSFTQLVTLFNTLQGGTQPDEATAMSMMGLYGNVLGVAVPISLLASALVLPAVIRSILMPEDSRFGYLRLGKDEARTLLILVLQVLLMGGVLFLVSMISALIGNGNMALTALAMMLSLLIFAAFGAWVAIKFSLAVPITIAEKRIGIADSFRMTKGNFWPLLGMGFIVAILSFGVSLLVNIISMPFAVISSGGFGILTGQAVTVGSVAGFIGTVSLSIILAAAQALIIYAPFAAAYRNLKNG